MSASRREFLLGLAAAGVIARVPSIASASVLYPSIDLSYFDTPIHHGEVDIKIGYASISWNENDTQAIEDISSAGYPGIQVRANVVKEFPDPHTLRNLLAKHNLQFVAFSSGSVPLDPALRESAIDTHVKNAQYLKDAGGKYLQLTGGSSKAQGYSSEDYRYQGLLLTDIAKRVADYGIQTGFHNHMGSISQTPEALDAILDAADPKYVKLELDTAHCMQGGGDPAAAIRKYGRRVLFLHLKDVKDAPTKNGYEFVELGEGRVDFPAIFDALHSIDFRGWGIVELDGEHAGVARTPKESAEISKTYLQQKFGVNL